MSSGPTSPSSPCSISLHTLPSESPQSSTCSFYLHFSPSTNFSLLCHLGMPPPQVPPKLISQRVSATCQWANPVSFPLSLSTSHSHQLKQLTIPFLFKPMPSRIPLLTWFSSYLLILCLLFFILGVYPQLSPPVYSYSTPTSIISTNSSMPEALKCVSLILISLFLKP